MAVAVLAVAVAGCLAGAALWLSTTSSSPVLAVARPVPAGAIITAEDLTQASVPQDSALATIPLAASSSVIGKRAATALAKGTLLAPQQVGPPVPLQPGESLVGIEVATAAAPVGWVRAGDRVQVVRTSTSADGRGGLSEVITEARVVDGGVARANAPGVSFVLAVPAAKAPDVTGASASQRIGLIVVESGH
jgi:Flp pilus assembly protein CpaB